MRLSLQARKLHRNSDTEPAPVDCGFEIFRLGSRRRKDHLLVDRNHCLQQLRTRAMNGRNLAIANRLIGWSVLDVRLAQSLANCGALLNGDT